MSATLAELESRVIALETERVDYRAVLHTVNTLSVQTRERLDAMDGKIDTLRTDLTDTNQRVRSIEETLAEMKDLLIRALSSGE